MTTVNEAVATARERFHHWHQKGRIRRFTGSIGHDLCKSPKDCDCACGTCRRAAGGTWRECWVPMHAPTYDYLDHSDPCAEAISSTATAVALLEATRADERTRHAVTTLRMALATLLGDQPPSAMEQRRRAKEEHG